MWIHCFKRSSAVLLGLFLTAQPFVSQAATNLKASLAMMSFNYTETSDANTELDNESGSLPGVHLDLALNGLVSNVYAELYQGSISYNGHTQQGDTFNSTTQQLVIRSGAILSLVNFSDGLELINGYTVNLWDRQIQGKDDVGGLHELYHWGEVSLGLRSQLRFSNRLRLETSLCGLQTIAPSMDAFLSSGVKTFDLGSQSGTRARAQVNYTLNTAVTIGASAFYENWGFGRSANQTLSDPQLSGEFYEPNSNSTHYGMMLDLATRF